MLATEPRMPSPIESDVQSARLGRSWSTWLGPPSRARPRSSSKLISSPTRHSKPTRRGAGRWPMVGRNIHGNPKMGCCKKAVVVRQRLLFFLLDKTKSMVTKLGCTRWSGRTTAREVAVEVRKIDGNRMKRQINGVDRKLCVPIPGRANFDPYPNPGMPERIRRRPKEP